MRAELPWNVAGIPPEAREAARAAARREGLSVGEWLTRRILRSFSGMEEELPTMPYDNRAPSGAPLDAWGLPQSNASRRDSEEMMARVGRSETESNDAWRRIEDQLRGLGRRLDSSERSHSEANRVISRTTQEINISAREQAQVFDQLGLNVMALNERLERLERSAANDGIKDAVKALHQGLSRLADQITATANNSASQTTQLAGNLEQLANRVGQARVDAEDGHKELEERINVTAQALAQRFENTDHRLDQRFEAAEQRLSGAEKTAQFNTNALDHALEKIEGAAGQRATDQVEQQRRAAQTEESLHRLEDSIARLEMRLPDAAFERRLDGIENSVGAMVQRLEQHDPAARFDSTMQALSHRLESLEKEHSDLAAELHTRRSPEPPAYAPPAYEPAAPVSYEPPPVAEAPPVHPQSAFADTAPGTDAFAPVGTPAGFSFEIPPETDPFAPATDFAPQFEDVFAAPQNEIGAEPENFLSQARRSARAAAEKAEGERRGRFSGFGWGKDAADGEEKAKPRYLIPAILGLLVVLAVAAGMVLMQRAKPVTPVLAIAKPAIPNAPTYSVPEPPNGQDTQFVVAPQAGSQAGADQAQQPGSDTDFTTQRSEPAPQKRTAPPLQQRDVRSAPVKPVPDGSHTGSDRVIQLANSGNPVALTILGLRALDGTNGSAVNLPDAVKFLTQAAEKGQAVAQYRLGTLYERGQGVPIDAAKAAHWYEMAANQGNRKAMHNLAVSFASGTARGKNMAEAGRWFAKAAALGLSDSQFNLAVLYERGDGVPQSLLDAYKWYSIAAAAGDTESKSRLAVLQTQLSDSDKAAANKSAATFHAASLNRSANVPPEAADLGS
jgi:localization factor PodJL